LLQVPIVNPLRFEVTAGGPANVAEFGSIAKRDEFAALLASDPYQRVRDGVAYPAVLLTAGTDDVRVPVWQPAKLAARLQRASSSGKPVLLRVERADGHFASSREQLIEEWADLMAFALWQSGVPVRAMGASRVPVAPGNVHGTGVVQIKPLQGTATSE
jgi:prolyl oligopeptidase